MPRVVVAENDQALAHLLEEILGGEGFDVVTLPASARGAGMPPRIDAELAIVDFPPGRAGRDESVRVINELRARANGPLPIIGVTADHELLRRAGSRFASLPGFAFIAKPFALDQLLDIVDVMLHLGRGAALFEHLDTLPAGVLVADAQRHYLHANESALRILGYTLDEITELGITDILQATPKATEELWNRYLTERGAGSARYELRHHDGTALMAEMHANVLAGFDEGDAVYISWLRPVAERGAPAPAAGPPQEAIPA